MAINMNERSLNILCIDDDAQIRGFLNDCITCFNHRVTLASGGKHGLELFRAAALNHQPFELVITDLGMPDMDGHRVTRAIKAECPDTPVILMTGWGTITSDDAGADLEVDAVISKPVRLQELKDLILQMTEPALA
jgi:CheY-like chemotaxis protein